MTQKQLEQGKFLMTRYYALNDNVGFLIAVLNQNFPLYINTGGEKSIMIPDELKNQIVDLLMEDWKLKLKNIESEFEKL